MTVHCECEHTHDYVHCECGHTHDCIVSVDTHSIPSAVVMNTPFPCTLSAAGDIPFSASHLSTVQIAAIMAVSWSPPYARQTLTDRQTDT
jgi:hypothetical protein